MEIYEIDVVKRLWAIFIFSSFAGVISQISSTQTDLCVGSLFSCSLLFILKFKKDKRLSYLFFSSLALGLSFGVKSTGVIGSVPLLIYYAFLLRKDFLKFFLFLSLNFILFSSYNYVLNFINYGNFLGSKSALLGHGFWGGPKAILANYIRYFFQLFDFSGFALGFFLNPYLLDLQDKALALFHIPKGLGENVALDFTNVSMTEQILGFGVLGFLVFLPCIIAGLFNKKLRVFSILFMSQILVLSFSIAYMIYSIRFIVAYLSLAMPLLTLSYFKKTNVYKLFIIVTAFFYMCVASLFLSQRPLYHLKKEYKKTPDIKIIQAKMRDLNYKFYPSFNEAYTMKSAVEPMCKENREIGIIVSGGYMLYSTKFLELNHACKIIPISLLSENDLRKYDILITQKDMKQKLNTINKENINNPSLPGYKTICLYSGLDKNRNQRILGFDELKDATDVECELNKEYIRFLGFERTGEINAEFPDYLKERENETVSSFYIWRKQ